MRSSSINRKQSKIRTKKQKKNQLKGGHVKKKSRRSTKASKRSSNPSLVPNLTKPTNLPSKEANMYRAEVNSRINEAKEYIRKITKATGDTNKQQRLIAELQETKLLNQLGNNLIMRSSISDIQKKKELETLVESLRKITNNPPERQKRKQLPEEQKLSINRAAQIREAEAQKAKAEAQIREAEAQKAKAVAVKAKNIRLDALAKYLATLSKNEMMKNQQYKALSNANKQALEAKISEEKKTASELSNRQTQLQSQKVSSVKLVDKTNINKFAEQEGKLARELALSRAKAKGISLTPEQLNKVEANARNTYLNPSKRFFKITAREGVYSKKPLSVSPNSIINVKKKEINEITNVNTLRDLQNEFPELSIYISNRIAKVQGAPPIRRNSKSLLMEGMQQLKESITKGIYSYEELLILRENYLEKDNPELKKAIDNAILRAAPEPEHYGTYQSMAPSVVASIKEQRNMESVVIAKRQAAKLKNMVKIKSNLKALEMMNPGGYAKFIENINGTNVVNKILKNPKIKARLKKLIDNIGEENV
jgi:hypothetical protein